MRRTSSAYRWLRSALLGIGILAVAILTIYVARTTYRVSIAAVAGREPLEDGAAGAWALLAAISGTALLAWLPRRGRSSGVGLAIGVGTACVVMALGVATYAPCVADDPLWYAPVSWVLALFTGGFEFEGPAAACALAFSPGFELARSLGLTLTVSGALGVVWIFARHMFDRWRAALSADADVVVGLSESTLPIIEILRAENRRRGAHEKWIDHRPGWMRGSADGRDQGMRTWWWWLSGARKGDLRSAWPARTATIVVETDPENPLIGEARQMGALVVVGDPTAPEFLRTLLTRGRPLRKPQAALRRLYAVTPRQSQNLAVWAGVRTVLESPRLRENPARIVPRVFVLMDDSREARQWRMSQIQHLGEPMPGGMQRPTLISDSLSLDGVTSEAIVERILPAREWITGRRQSPHIVLVGESGLALAILDELAWQLWCRYEVAHAAQRPAEAAKPRLARITLCGPRAQARRSEWNDLRAPWAFPQGSDTPFEIFTVVASRDDEEDEAEVALAREPDSIVVFTDDRPDYAAMASRLARRFPSPRGEPARVILRSDAVAGAEPAVPGGLLRVRPRLTRSDPGSAWAVPSDSVSRHAQQQHRVFQAMQAWPTESGLPRSPRGARLTGVPWQDLPEFFQEDNVRQYWQILTWFTRHGFSWEPVRTGDAPVTGEIGTAELLEVTLAEYRRWAALRLSRGWRPCEPGFRDDSARLHPDLRGWEVVDQEYNVSLVRLVLDRMWASGLAPRRTGATDPQPVPLAEQLASHGSSREGPT